MNNSEFLAILPYSNDKILSYFSFSKELDNKNENTEIEDRIEFRNDIPEDFDAKGYLVSILNISDIEAGKLLSGDFTSILHPPSYEIGETYIARYKNGTLLSGISNDNIILYTINKLLEDNKISITDIPNILTVKYNPEFTESLSHISARVKRRLKHKEISIAVCTISLEDKESETNIKYKYYIPNSFNGTVIEYNKKIEENSTILYNKPLENGWIILGLDTTKNYQKLK